MAKVQIGAVIGVEGAKEYKAQLDACTAATKNLASQTKLVEASFEGTTKSVNDLARQKLALQGEINGVSEKLAVQRAKLSAVVEAYKRGDENALQYKNQMINLATETNKTEAELYKLESRMKSLNEENGLTLALKAWQDSTSKTGEALKTIGTGLTKYVTAPIAGIATVGVKTFADIESAFAGVKKTVNWDEATMSVQELEEELRKLPLETASTTEEIMAIAEAAGQLGVSADEIPFFTKNITMLADATNVAGQEGAVSIAQFLNIMGEGTETVDQFGSALVDLGNNSATDEASILALATRLASAGKFAGLTTPEILGLSAAMSSVGLTAEAGGTAMSTTLNLITKAVAEGGDDLQTFAEVTGQTAEQFAEKWRTDAVGALQDLLVGFFNLEGGSEELLQLMDELGWAGIRQSDTVRRLTLNYDGVKEAVDRANTAYDENTKLVEEAEQRYETFDSQMSQLKESFRLFASSVGKSLGESLKPIIEDLTQVFVKLDEWWRGLDQNTQNTIMVITGLVAAIGPALVIVGNILIFIAKFKGAIEALSLGSKLTALGGTISSLASTVGAFVASHVGIILAIGAIVAAIIWVREHSEQILAFWEGAKEGFALIWEVIKFAFEEGVNLIKEKFREFQDKVTELRNKVDTGFQNMVQGAKNKFNDFKSAVETLRSNIDSTFRNLISNAWNWGKDLIGNIVSGIRSKISSVISAVSDVASTIWSYLHFSEPETGALSNFHTWMPDFMKGLAQGIDANAYLVDNAISRVADSLGMGGNTTNYGGVIINLNVPQGANGYQLVDEMEQALAQKTMRRKAVFG